jgi:hypothetical protein
VYAATVRDRRLNFQVSGMLWNRSLVMRDLETKSLWSHILGEAMQGELKGEKLQVIPSTIASWESWKSDHPDTTVLALDRTARQFKTDFQNRPDAFVLGLAARGKAKAWPFDILRDHPVINDTFDGRPLLVTFDKKSTAARMFHRKLDDLALEFATADDGTLTDKQTSSTWNPATSRCTDGKLKGQSLKPLPAIISFTKAWNTFHPDSETYKAP